jgi:hypothetical protein
MKLRRRGLEGATEELNAQQEEVCKEGEDQTMEHEERFAVLQREQERQTKRYQIKLDELGGDCER